MLVATAGRFRYADGADGLRQRLAAVSKMSGMIYWSTTSQRWQPFILDAFAVSDAAGQKRRPDFAPEDLAEGRTFYLQQQDELFGKGTYRVQIRASTPERLVFATENTTTMKYLIVPVFQPGEMQSITFLDRESQDVWRYYSLVRAGGNTGPLLSGHKASFMNRAVALYRFLAGIPMDQEPPAAK
jgi:hypothetical protein